jgi:VWFA-related protein
MHRSIAQSLIALCAAITCAAQEAPPPTAPTGADVVRLDLIVRDKRGQPVLDLRQDEIQVAEDGKRREISSVRLVQAGNAASPARPRVVVLVFETMIEESALRAREVATELASRSFPPDTWFAVARIGPGARLFQTLTSNPADLLQAILAATGAGPSPATDLGSRTPQGSRGLAVDGDGQPRLTGLDLARREMGAVFNRRLRTPGHPYLVPLRGIVQSLGPVEGRKALIYFSEGLRLSARKTRDTLAGDASRATYSDDRQTLEALVNDANRANVAIYPLDVIGLTGLRSQDTSRDIPPPSTASVDTSQVGLHDQVDAFRGGLYAAQRRAPRSQGAIDTLKSLAQDTGGVLIANGRGLSEGLDLVASDLSSYYEVTYAAQGGAGAGRFRRIEAKVLRRGASLRTRRGYSGSPSTPPEEPASSQGDLVAESNPPATDAVTTPSSDPALATLLERAGQYVSDYEQTFKNLLAEEEYDQRGNNGRRRRSLRSDLLFSSTPGPIPWTCFRDVYEVDGKKVREREARLEKLFLQGTPSAIAKAEAIRKESSRYNIGSATRNVNVPTLALLFLLPENQSRFRFERKGQKWFSGTPGAELHFTEVVEPSLVSDGHDDLPGEGRFWIDPNRGTVLRSEVTYRFAPRRAYAEISVEYRPEPGLNIWVPAEMKERYADVPGAWAPVFGSRTTGTATYSNYRRFTVSTEERAQVPEP